MKKVVLLGDSIRQIGYGTVLQDYLGDEYTIWQSEDNCRWAQYTLRMLFDYKDQIQDADIIHWNNGMWDVTVLFEDGVEFTPIGQYLETLDRIATILLKITPNVIFSLTTPVHPEYPYNSNETIKEYNRRAAELLSKRGIKINDLFSVIYPDVENNLREDKIHLNDKGIALAATSVSKAIKDIK